MPVAPRSGCRGSPSTPATRRRPSTPGRGGWARPGGRDQGRRGLQPAGPVIGPTYVDATEGGKRIRRGARLWTVAVATFKSETYRFLRLDAAGRRRRVASPAGYDPPAARRRRRMGEAAGRRAAGDGEDQARLHPARMAEAPGAQRGARLPGLRPRRRLDRRPRSLAASASGGSWRSSWGSRRKRRHPPRAGDRRTRDARRSSVGSARPAVPLAGRPAAELAAATVIEGPS